MKINPHKKTQQVLKVMLVITWIACIGLLIETGAILISYGVSFVNPEAAKDLYKGMDLYNLSQFNFWYYTMSVSFKVAFPAMKAMICFSVISILSKVKITNPFTIDVALTLEKISYSLLGLWFVAILNNEYIHLVMKRTGASHEHMSTQEYIFMAGIVFVISQVFKRGVEIQSENELTV